MSKTNIIVDGNYLFHKTLFSFDGFRSKKGIMLGNSDAISRFIRKVSTDFSYSLKSFSDYSKIVYTIDSSSWRKSVEIDDQDHTGYKGNRNRTEYSDIDWNAFYDTMNEFADILRSKGVIVSKIPSAEGDDLMYLWSKYMLESGENSIVFTGDRDIHQIVTTTESNYTLVYNTNSKNRGLFVPEGFSAWLAEHEALPELEDVFSMNASEFMGTAGVDLVRAAIERSSVTEIDPKAIVLSKILCGDGGDNIPSVHIWTSNGKQKRITPKDYKKVLSKLLELHGDVDIQMIYDSEEYRNLIHRTLQDSIKLEINRDTFNKKIIRNVKFVWLHENVIPSNIIDNFNNTVESYKHTYPEKFDKITLLEDTKYAKAGVTMESDVFKLL